MGLAVGLEALRLRPLNGLRRMVLSGSKQRAAGHVVNMASTPTTVARLMHHQRGFNYARSLEREAVALALSGGVEYAGGLTAWTYAVIDANLNDNPGWYDALKLIPFFGMGMEIGEAINVCLLGA